MRVPTINELQDLWVYKRVNQYFDENRPAPDHSLFIAEFNEAIDKIKADAWDEGWNAGHFDYVEMIGNDDYQPQDNPYRKQEEV
jgi:hypothetical protein